MRGCDEGGIKGPCDGSLPAPIIGGTMGYIKGDPDMLPGIGLK